MVAYTGTIYSKSIKRIIDLFVSIIMLIILLPFLLILSIIGAIAMKGNPFFVQPRPGKKDDKTGKEKIFNLIKFRTMSNLKDEDGNLLPDELRLNSYGEFLRSTSLDELPELINIIKGELSFVGPRPQLVRDMVFMDSEQRQRHNVRPGLTGLAQISGRNNISWEEKFEYDLKYINSCMTPTGDIKILVKTISKVLNREDTVREGTVSDMDLGDYLLQSGKISDELYVQKQMEAKTLLNGRKC